MSIYVNGRCVPETSNNKMLSKAEELTVASLEEREKQNMLVSKYSSCNNLADSQHLEENRVIQNMNPSSTDLIEKCLIDEIEYLRTELEKYKQQNAQLLEEKNSVYASLKSIHITFLKNNLGYMERFKKWWENEEVIPQISTIIEDSEKKIKKLQEVIQKRDDEVKKSKYEIQGLKCKINRREKEQIEELKRKDDERDVIKMELQRTIINEQQINAEQEDFNRKLKKSIEQHKIKINNQAFDLNQLLTQLQAMKNELELTREKLANEETSKENLEKAMDFLKSTLHSNEINFAIEINGLKKDCHQFSQFLTNRSRTITIEEVRRGAEERFIRETVAVIGNIEKEARQYEVKINNFAEGKMDKIYLHIREMLHRQVEKLDRIESFDNEKIQKRKKNCVIYIRNLQNRLENKVTSYK